MREGRRSWVHHGRHAGRSALPPRRAPAGPDAHYAALHDRAGRGDGVTTTAVEAPTDDDERLRPARWRRPLEVTLVVVPSSFRCGSAGTPGSWSTTGTSTCTSCSRSSRPRAVYNLGQRVEVFTGPLWTFILVPAVLVSPASMETSHSCSATCSPWPVSCWPHGGPHDLAAPDPGAFSPRRASWCPWPSTPTGGSPARARDGARPHLDRGCAMVLAASGNRTDPTLRRFELVVLGLGP